MGKKKNLASDEVENRQGDEIEDLKEWIGEAEEGKAGDQPQVLAELREERDELMDRLLRKQAEFENYRKRVLREKTETRLSAQEEILKEILSILDSCEMGLQSFPDSASEEDPRMEAYRQGYELLWKSLQALLARFGVTPVPGPGQPFDPAFHEAVLREENSDFEDGHVIEEFRRGYLFQGRLLRPSQVRVAVHPEEATSN